MLVNSVLQVKDYPTWLAGEFARDTGLRRGPIQTMPKDAPPAMSTYGMREQNVLAVIFHSGSDERPNFANHAKIKRLLVLF